MKPITSSEPWEERGCICSPLSLKVHFRKSCAEPTWALWVESHSAGLVQPPITVKISKTTDTGQRPRAYLGLSGIALVTKDQVFHLEVLVHLVLLIDLARYNLLAGTRESCVTWQPSRLT